MSDPLIPRHIWEAIAADLDKPSFFEGVVVDTSRTVEEFCQGVVESMTEWDWAEVPDHLRADLRAWTRDFYAWMRTQR